MVCSFSACTPGLVYLGSKKYSLNRLHRRLWAETLIALISECCCTRVKSMPTNKDTKEGKCVCVGGGGGRGKVNKHGCYNESAVVAEFYKSLAPWPYTFVKIIHRLSNRVNQRRPMLCFQKMPYLSAFWLKGNARSIKKF